MTRYFASNLILLLLRSNVYYYYFALEVRGQHKCKRVSMQLPERECGNIMGSIPHHRLVITFF